MKKHSVLVVDDEPIVRESIWDWAQIIWRDVLEKPFRKCEVGDKELSL